MITSQVSRQFIFKLPYPALGKQKGPITPLMLKKIYLRKGMLINLTFIYNLLPYIKQRLVVRDHI